MQSIDDLIRILQLAVSPVVLISGVGLLILSMTNRLSHMIDRMRNIHSEILKAPATSDVWEDQLTVLIHRSHLLKKGLIMFVSSILLDSLIIIALFFIKLTGVGSGILIAILFSLSSIAVFIGLIFYAKDIVYSLHALELELRRR